MKYLAIIVVLLLTGCTENDRATATLSKSGYKDINITGYDAFACGKDDWSSTKFIASNPLGQRVEGVVCCGAWKYCTVRF